MKNKKRRILPLYTDLPDSPSNKYKLRATTMLKTSQVQKGKSESKLSKSGDIFHNYYNFYFYYNFYNFLNFFHKIVNVQIFTVTPSPCRSNFLKIVTTKFKVISKFVKSISSVTYTGLTVA